VDVPQSPRRLVAVFSSPVSEALLRLGPILGFQSVLVEPDPARLRATTGVGEPAAAGINEHTDVVLTDHDRPEVGPVLRAVLAGTPRWVGIMGNPRHQGPHVAALRALGADDAEIARVHRPVGLNIGSRTPAEIAVATLAGLIADRNGRPGGFDF